MKTAIVKGLVLACTALDYLPMCHRIESWWRWRWYRHGLLGCQLGMADWSVKLDQRWRTGVWQETTE
jgi:hypothetical protein